MICWVLTDQPALIGGLLRPEAYGHAVESITLLETHISWVILTGAYAYKLNKPVDLGFLDFTSLERRHHFCLEELRLNRRFGSDLYLAVLPVTGSEGQPQMGGPGVALEYAVQMRQFAQADLLPAALERGAINAAQIEAFAEQLARFHAGAAVASSDSLAAVREPVWANFRTLLGPATAGQDAEFHCQVREQRHWAERELARLEPRFAARLAAGRVRECHGDLHLGNLVLHRGQIEPFDCLEFSSQLRWIDVISDLAFLGMDLQQRGHPGLAVRLLNRWLETSGDYAALELWRWYGSYRALVRAKVAALGGQAELAGAYLAQAQAISRRRPQLLLICHGFSGAGKSHHSAELLEPLEAIRIRSDLERKRLFGLWGQALAPPRQGDPYAPAVSEELFAELLPAQAAAVLVAGFSAIVDATFLRQLDRQRMAAVAQAARVPLLILDFQVPVPLLRQRISARQQQGRDPSDADWAVLKQQIAMAEPLTASEQQRAVPVGVDQPAATTVQALRQRLAATGANSRPASS